MGPKFDPESLLAHQDFVRGLARQLARDRDRADDVAQDSWLNALTRRPTRGESPRGWLARIVRNASRDAHRRAARRERREAQAVRGSVPSTADVVEREAARRRVVDAVLALREPYRSAILLRYYDLEPPRAIANRLGVPVETVRTHLKRGLEMLRASLGANDPPPRRSVALAAAGGLAVKSSSKLGIAAAALLIAAIAVSPLLLEWLDFGGREPADARLAEASPIAGDARDTDEVVASPAEEAVVEDATFGVLEGQVVDEAGAAVAAARVVAHQHGMPARFLPGERLPRGAHAAGCGQDGRFRIPLSGPPASRRLFVEAAGFSASSLDAVAAEPARIVLERGLTLSGTVRDADERPVGGARVQVLGLIGPVRVEQEAVSQPDGTYRLAGIASERVRRGEWRSWCVVTSAPGFAPQLTSAGDLFKLARDGEVRFDPYLVRGAVVTGRVRDAETGVAIAGARLFLLSAEGVEYPHDDYEGENPYCPRLLDRATSGAAGEFEFTGFPAEGPLPLITNSAFSGGPVAGKVGALVDGYCPAAAFIVASPDGARIDVSIDCWPAARVTGRVVDETGRPIPGVLVYAGSKERLAHLLPRLCEGARRLRATTDADGRYLLDTVPAGRGGRHEVGLKVWEEQPPYRTVNGAALVRGGETTVAADLALPQKRVSVVVITVSDREGAPVPGATIRHDSGPGLLGGHPTTDDRGSSTSAFHPDPGARRERRALVEAPGFARSMTPPFTPVPGEVVEVRVTVDRGHRITGKAYWNGGQPAAGTDVHAFPAGPSPEDVLPWLYGRGWDRILTELATAPVQGDGSFELRVKAKTAQRLVASVGRRALSTVLVPPDAADVRFELDEAAPVDEAGATLDGTVVDASSRAPILRFKAQVQDGPNVVSARRTGPGRFQCQGLRPGRFRLKVSADGFPPVEQDVEIEAGKANAVTVSVTTGITLRGRVIVSGDVRLHGSILSLTRTDSNDEHYARIRADGTFEIVGLAPGDHRVSFVEWGPGMPEYDYAPEDPIDLTLTADKEQTRDIPITKGGMLIAQIRDGPIGRLLDRGVNRTPEEQAALDRVVVEVFDAGGRLIRSSKGLRTTTWRLPYGTYQVRIQSPDMAPWSERVVIDSGWAAASFHPQ